MLSLLRRLSSRRKQRTAREAAALAQRATDLRQQARTSGPLSGAELRELAGLEDVYLGPGRSRSARFHGDDLELGAGLVARLGRPDGDYWFLGRDGRFYVCAAHALGRAGDLVAVPAGNARVPPDLEDLAWVYRQLCD
ncbi:hypothetical protein F4809DRAFT_646834 [Biscogniauxia mediterranea]|nr:hypothetical protein F4809DRAFT_646834 [Biscogniauxia mediterranea]